MAHSTLLEISCHGSNSYIYVKDAKLDKRCTALQIDLFTTIGIDICFSVGSPWQRKRPITPKDQQLNGSSSLSSDDFNPENYKGRRKVCWFIIFARLIVKC